MHSSRPSPERCAVAVAKLLMRWTESAETRFLVERLSLCGCTLSPALPPQAGEGAHLARGGDRARSALIRRAHRERADRNHMAIAVVLGAVGERGIDGGLLIGGFQAETGAARGAGGDGIPAHAVGELAHHLVAG